LYKGQWTDGNPKLVGRHENHSDESEVPPKSRFGGQGQYLGPSPNVPSVFEVIYY